MVGPAGQSQEERAVAKTKKPLTALQAAPVASDAMTRRVKKDAGMLAPPKPKGADPTPTPAGTGQKLQIKPGVERWPVKTGTDDDVAKVNLAGGVVRSTVEELQAASRPQVLDTDEQAYQAKRIAPVETTVWQVDCHITAVKFEADGDYHLVLQGTSGETMIGEIPDPDPEFVRPPSPFIDDIRRARAVADAKILSKVPAMQFAPMGKYMVPLAAFSAPVAAGKRTRLPRGRKTGPGGKAPPGTTFKAAITPIAVRITGVGFFDRLHGQMGVAPNGIELHPVLDLELL